MKDKPDALTIRELVSYRLQKAAYYATKHSYVVYTRKFGITGVEWRLIGNLYTDGPLSLVRLAEEVDIQLAQASRMMSSLIKRGLAQLREALDHHHQSRNTLAAAHDRAACGRLRDERLSRQRGNPLARGAAEHGQTAKQRSRAASRWFGP